MKTKRIKIVVLSSLPLKMMTIHSEGTKPVVCQRKRFRNEEEVKRGRRGKQSRTSFYKPMTSRAQIDGMNCEQLLEEIKQRFQSKKETVFRRRERSGGGGGDEDENGERRESQNHPRTEFEPSTIEIEGFKHEISERLASFLGFGEGESGVKATRRFVDRRLKSYCEEMRAVRGRTRRKGKESKEDERSGESGEVGR